MIKNLLKLLWVFLILSFAIVYLLLVLGKTVPGYLLHGLFMLGAFSWVYITVRMFSFNKQVTRFFRYLLAGNYETGISVSERINDEVTKLAQLINKAGDQLRVYDKMRAERVGFSYRMIDMICRTVEEAIIIADIEKGIFQFNLASQELFEVKKEKIPFETMRKQDGNSKFMALFDSVVSEKKVPQEGRVALQLPIRKSKKELSLKLLPVKDNDEAVKFVLIFVSQAE
ncbi:MAG: hypothetical protein ABIH89_05440 [Elusimicrobiota bacterium]